MNFFKQFHRTFTDPTIFNEVKIKPLSFSIIFLLKQIIIVTAITTIFFIVRLFDKENGVPNYLPHLFPGMVISDQGIVKSDKDYYAVDPHLITGFYSLLHAIGNNEDVTFTVTDTLIIVDLRDSFAYDSKSTVPIILAKDSVYFTTPLLKSFGKIVYSYKDFLHLGANESITLTKDGIHNYLFSKKQRFFIIKLFVLFLFTNFIGLVFNNVFTSIFFLVISVFLFKKEYISFENIVKCTIFSLAPIMLEIVIRTIAGTTIGITKYIAIFISAFIIFRGINVSILKKDVGENK